MTTEAGQELCLNCAKPNPAGAHLCRHCGAPLTTHAATDPYLGVFAEGHAIQKAAARPHKPIILIGIWLLGIPALLVSGFVLYAALRIPPEERSAAILGAAVGLGFLALWTAIVYKTTRNYVRLRQSRGNSADRA